MLRHVVLYSLKPEACGATAMQNAALMREKLEGLVGVIPAIRHMEVRENVNKNGPALVLYAEFDDEQGLQAYIDHPAHQQVRTFVHSVIADRIAADWTV